MNAWQKAYQGWFGGCNGVKRQLERDLHAAAAGAVLQRHPVPADQGPEGARVQPPGGGRRQRQPRDVQPLLRRAAHAAGLRRHAREPLGALADGADSRRQRSAQPHAGGASHLPARHDTVHDRGTSGFNDAGLAAGQTFTDPAGGLSITATAVSATSATIEVTYTVEGGAPTCLDGTTFTPPGAATCGDGRGRRRWFDRSAGAGGSTGTAGVGGAVAARAARRAGPRWRRWCGRWARRLDRRGRPRRRGGRHRGFGGGRGGRQRNGRRGGSAGSAGAAAGRLAPTGWPARRRPRARRETGVAGRRRGRGRRHRDRRRWCGVVGTAAVSSSRTPS